MNINSLVSVKKTCNKKDSKTVPMCILDIEFKDDKYNFLIVYNCAKNDIPTKSWAEYNENIDTTLINNFYDRLVSYKCLTEFKLFCEERLTILTAFNNTNKKSEITHSSSSNIKTIKRQKIILEEPELSDDAIITNIKNIKNVSTISNKVNNIKNNKNKYKSIINEIINISEEKIKLIKNKKNKISKENIMQILKDFNKKINNIKI